MPKKVTAYSCGWRCGRNVIMSKKRMEAHEEYCFYNPIRKACVTCKKFTGRNGEEVNWCDDEIDIDIKLKCHCDKYELNKLMENKDV